MSEQNLMNQDIDQMKTVTEGGAPVKERITSIAAARAVHDQLKEDDQELYRRARLKGLIDGNPPYNSSRLKELGMGHKTNINFLEARAILDQKASARFELFFEVPTLIDVQLSPLLPPNPQASAWGKIIAEEFTRLLFDWPGYLYNAQIAGRECDAYGVGVMLWRDEWDWRPKAFHRGNFRFPARAELDVTTLPVFSVRDSFTLSDLYKWALEDEKLSQEEGWVPAAVKRLFIKIYLKGETQDQTDVFQTSEWESLQQRLRDNDWSVQDKAFSDIDVVHICVAEGDTGEVSHYIMSETPDAGRDEFLYRKPRRFNNMRNALWLLPYNDGDRYIRSCRGLASMIQPHCDLSNRYLSQVFDAGFLTGSLILQPKSAVDMSKLQLIRMGAITIIPPGTETIQTSFTPKISELVILRDLSSSIMKNNSGTFRQNPELFSERQPQKTARQVVEEVAKESRMEKANIAYEYYHFEQLYKEMFRRMLQPGYIQGKANYPGKAEARQFVFRCIKRGVPQDLMFAPGIWDVHVTRAIGMGSWGVKLDLSNQVLAQRYLYDEEGQTNAARDWLAVRVGYQNVDRYKPMKNRDLVSSNESSLAVLENNDLVEGTACSVGSDQVHAVHFRVHVALLSKLVEQFNTGNYDPMQMAKILGVILPHTEETLKYLAQDPTRKDFVDQGVAFLKEAGNIYKQVVKQAEQQQAELDQVAEENAKTVKNAEEVVKSRETELAFQKMIREYELDKMKAESLVEMRKTKTAEQMDLRREQVSQEMQLKAERQAAELQMNAIKTSADVDLKRLKAATPTNVPEPGK